MTSGLPDDSREADERVAERRLRDLRGRVKAARAALAGSPGATEAMHANWRKEAGLLARFDITQGQFRQGVVAVNAENSDLSVPIDDARAKSGRGVGLPASQRL